METVRESGAITLLANILIATLLLFLFQKILWLVVPALLSLILYYCFRPVVEFLVIRGIRHETAAKLVWVVLQLTASCLVLAVALIVLARAETWQNQLNHYFGGGLDLIHKTGEALEKVVPSLKQIQFGAQVEDHIRQFTSQFAEKNLLPVLLQLVKWLPSLLLVPYTIYYLLSDSTRLKKYIISSVPNAFFEKALLLFSRLDASLQNYFGGLLLLTLLDTLCLALGLRMVGMANAVWLGFVSAELAWIPYLGSAIGCIAIFLIAATDYPEKAWMAYACLVLFVTVRALDDLVFVPLTVGRKLRIHPLLGVLMMFVGATVAGATGLMLALPLFGVVAVFGEIVSEVVTDPKLIARYRAARKLAFSSGTP